MAKSLDTDSFYRRDAFEAYMVGLYQLSADDLKRSGYTGGYVEPFVVAQWKLWKGELMKRRLEASEEFNGAIARKLGPVPPTTGSGVKPAGASYLYGQFPTPKSVIAPPAPTPEPKKRKTKAQPIPEAMVEFERVYRPTLISLYGFIRSSNDVGEWRYSSPTLQRIYEDWKDSDYDNI